VVNVAYRVLNVLRRALVQVQLPYLDLVWLRLQVSGLLCSQQSREQVVFMVADVSIWDVFSAIHKRLISDDRFVVTVVAFHRVDISVVKPQSEVEQFFRNRGIEVEFLSESQQKKFSWKSYDYAFFTLGTGAFPKRLNIRTASRYCRTIYLAYGMLLGDHHEYQYNSDSQHFAWRLLAANQIEVHNYRLHARYAKTRVLFTGYTKFEDLANTSAPITPPSRPLVIWAPHWTVGNRSHNRFGTFDQVSKGMLNLVRANPELDFVLKPHPNLADEFDRLHSASGRVFQQYLRDFESESNARVACIEDTATLFLQSTAMITDSISFLGDYLFTLKPLFFLDRSERRLLNELGEAIIQSHYKGRGVVDIQLFLSEIVESGLDPKRVDRERLRRVVWDSDSGLPSEIIRSLLLNNPVIR